MWNDSSLVAFGGIILVASGGITLMAFNGSLMSLAVAYRLDRWSWYQHNYYSCSPYIFVL